MPSGNGEQILIVDDEHAVLQMTAEALETFVYRPLAAKNGPEAVALFQQHPGRIQAVIGDMMLPIMDGPGVIEALRKVDPHVRVIGISGLGSESVLLKAGKLNVHALLRKPFTPERLLRTLRDVLSKESLSHI